LEKCGPKVTFSNAGWLVDVLSKNTRGVPCLTRTVIQPPATIRFERGSRCLSRCLSCWLDSHRGVKRLDQAVEPLEAGRRIRTAGLKLSDGRCSETPSRCCEGAASICGAGGKCAERANASCMRRNTRVQRLIAFFRVAWGSKRGMHGLDHHGRGGVKRLGNVLARQGTSG